MVFSSFAECPAGVMHSGVVLVVDYVEDWVIGLEESTGTKVAFKHVGCSDCYLTLYQAIKTDGQFCGAWILQWDPSMPPVGSRLPQPHDFGHAHDVCCGLGGFATAMHYLEGQIVTAVDCSALAIETYALNHPAVLLCSNIGDMSTVHAMHVAQKQKGVQPMLMAGYPCQPYSMQGHRGSEHDSRSRTLTEILKCASLLKVCALLLECVPNALHDQFVQKTIHEFAQREGFCVTQLVLDLHSVWPAKRSRCFSILTPLDFGPCVLHGMPVLHPLPSLRDVLPFDPWPVWDPKDEQELKWTEHEIHMFGNPAYGNPNRKLDMTQALPTALHSWGSPLDACPCGCRSQGFSLQALMSRGLRGVEVNSGAYPYASRHIHPRELQLLLGFPPMQQVHGSCKAQLCLFGNAVSPIQGLWTLMHLFKHVGFLDAAVEPRAILSNYLGDLLKQRDVTWPSPGVGVACLKLQWPDHREEIAFNTSQTVRDLQCAEQHLANTAQVLDITCEGLTLPPWAFLQERTYEVRLNDVTTFANAKGPVFLWYLGVETWVWVPVTFSNRLLLKWHGITEFVRIVDEHYQEIGLNARVRIGSTVIVQQDGETVALDLDLGTVGFGLIEGVTHGGLRFSDSFAAAGLWQLDQWVKSNSLVSWAGTGYEPLTIWLPSLAEALVEFWPGTIDDRLQEWTVLPHVRLYAIVWEFWGWNLVKFLLDSEVLTVTFFEPLGCASGTVSRLASRFHQVSGCSERVDQHVQWSPEGIKGSLPYVFALLDQDLGLPEYVVQALAQVRPNWPKSVTRDECECSPTLSWTLPSQQPTLLKEHPKLTAGLSARFLLEFTQALIKHEPITVMPEQVKVLSITPQDECWAHGDTKLFQATDGPLFLFVLAAGHWTFVHVCLVDSVLHFTHYDGLACTSLSQLAPLIDVFKLAWKPSSIVASSTWLFPQRKSHTCGSLAIAHFAYRVGLITYGQGFDFEEMHDSLAICSGLLFSGGPIGFGPEEQAVTETLEQILPSKGVPKDELSNRIQAAIKTFGTQALSKALNEKQVWPALKQLGSNRPKPFFWVTHHELQLHIQERGQSKFGASLDMKKGRKAKIAKKPPIAAQNIDPSTLQLLPGLFSTNDGQPLQQLAMQQVVRDARGVAFTSPSEAAPFLAAGKMISGDGLALLIVGSPPKETQTSVPLNAMRVPAIYKPTNEPIIVECTVAQLGDQAVYQKHSPQAPSLDVYPTAVFRLHIFHDLWTEHNSWDDLVKRPIKSLVASYDILRLCRTEGCSGTDCGMFHPSLEEEGIESGLVDVWGFRWATYDGAKAQPEKAQVLSVYVRVPESSFHSLHGSSGQLGVFFEPRSKDEPGPDQSYAVVWGPSLTLQDGLHRMKTQDICVAVCRLGHKIGLRCLKKHQEELHRELCPNKPFVDCQITSTFRLEPLPAGIQRQSLLDLIVATGWTAKPLHPVKGAQGAWLVGSDQDPPHPFIEAKHGWVSVTKVKDHTTQSRASDVVATEKTKHHIQHTSGTAVSPSQDPWQRGEDPWGGWKGVSKPAPTVPSTHVQQKLDDVETRLSTQVQHVLAKELTDFKDQQQKSDRLSALELQVQSLAGNQIQLDQQVAAVHKDCNAIHAALTQCHQQVEQQGNALQSVVTDVGQCQQTIAQQSQTLTSVVNEVAGVRTGLQNQTSQLELYFQRQTEQIEAMLSKRSRHEWLGHPGPPFGSWGVPPSKCRSRRGFLSTWWILLALCAQFLRIGEAAVPGPTDSADASSCLVPPTWTLPGSPNFIFGVGNPSGISNKLHVLDSFGTGWFHLAETQASRYQQSRFQSHMKQVASKQGRHIRTCVGAGEEWFTLIRLMDWSAEFCRRTIASSSNRVAKWWIPKWPSHDHCGPGATPGARHGNRVLPSERADLPKSPRIVWTVAPANHYQFGDRPFGLEMYLRRFQWQEWCLSSTADLAPAWMARTSGDFSRSLCHSCSGHVQRIDHARPGMVVARASAVCDECFPLGRMAGPSDVVSGLGFAPSL